MNWMMVEEYLKHDDRAVLPIGSTEQHAYLSLVTDTILAERLAVEAAEPLGVPVFLAATQPNSSEPLNNGSRRTRTGKDVCACGPAPVYKPWGGWIFGRMRHLFSGIDWQAQCLKPNNATTLKSALKRGIACGPPSLPKFRAYLPSPMIAAADQARL